jgi:hypothetical protein
MDKLNEKKKGSRYTKGEDMWNVQGSDYNTLVRQQNAIIDKMDELDADVPAEDELSSDELAAIQGAASPDGINVFATMDDVQPALDLIDSLPKVYRAIIHQTGTAAPTAIVLENSLGQVPVWAYIDAGKYSLTGTANVFTSNKTFLSANVSLQGGMVYPFQSSQLAIHIYTGQTDIETGVFTHGNEWIPQATPGYVEITVYP